jgi:DUF1365 family protein
MPDRAQLCFGHVHHKRLRPIVHSFMYNTFYVRLPLRAMAQSGFASRFFSRNRFNLLSFRDRDHGDGKQPLLDWITALLGSEGIFDANGEIWLQTMPRVLGYAFNPVSFWYCYRNDGALRAVLVDVHNTFGERHFYLLDHHGLPIGNAQTLSARKVFHVSPFCPVEGLYQFRFARHMRILDNRPGEFTIASIDYDDAHGRLLETSVSGHAQTINDRTVLRAFFSFPLMTLAVVVRIHWQALKLWRRRVPFFHKPDPPQQQVSK